MTVLVLLYNVDIASQWTLRGIRREADRAGWTIRVLEYERIPGGYRFHRAEGGADIPAMLDFWKPDGCIVECDGTPDIIPASAFAGVPAVFVNRPPDADAPESVCVPCDETSVANCAARELLLAGFDDLAYVSCPDDPAWSGARGEAFRRVVERYGRRFHRFRFGPATLDASQMLGELVPWLRGLPRPCGVFAANDRVAEGVLVACEKLGFAVPDDVAVVGVDNLEYVCENMRPTLTSVENDLYGAGRTAARTLAGLLAGRLPPVPPSFGTVRLVRRGSTLFVRNGDRRVLKALEYIRRRACEGATAADVVRGMGLSRRMADGVFHRAMGRTILDEILAVRLAKAMELLRRHVPVALLPDQCGFGSLANLRRTFRNRVGMPIGAWAAKNAR